MGLEGRSLVIRADASAQIGSGHLMRCLALGQAWEDHGGQVIFITTCDNPALQERLKREGFSIVPVDRPHPDPGDWATTHRVLREHPGAWVVLDGYHFDPSYQQQIRELGHPLLVIDDMAHLEHYYADVLLNPNIHAPILRYSVEPTTHFLLGTHYALLRREFLLWEGWHREIPEVARKLLVTLGGGDPNSVTLDVIRALGRLDVKGLKVVVVIGPHNLNYKVVRSAASTLPHKIRLAHNVTDMPELMAWADVAVTAAGNTFWEAAFMGLPSVLIAVAENQKGSATHLAEMGISVVGLHSGRLSSADLVSAIKRLVLSANLRQEMSTLIRKLVDGEGARRVVAHLREPCRLILRHACESDTRLIWEWANDPDTRAASFSMDPIPWETHVRWLRSKLLSPNCRFFLASNCQGDPVGMIRFELSDDEAEVSANVAREFRGIGYGSQLIRIGCAELFRGSSVRRIIAHIKPENERSIKSFVKAGFVPAGRATVRGQEALKFVLERSDLSEGI